MRVRPKVLAHLASAALLACGAGCAHGPRPAPALPVVHAAPVHVTAGDPTDALLATLNDEELFAKGNAAYASADYALAAKAFDRLCDVFPKSPHFAAATYNAGLAHEQLAAKAPGDAAALEWDKAVYRYQPLLDIEHGTHDQIDAGFRAAECLYHLDKYADAIALLRRIQARTDLSANLLLEAETQVGICQVELGELEGGEHTLRDVVHKYESATDAERLDDYYPAQAQFFLGEIYRGYFEQVVLDPNLPGGTDKLAQDLEYKAEMLLSAQGHYLRAIRMGNPRWATASGQRIGELYESLYDDMTRAPVPDDLDPEQAALYRQALRKKVRVLVTKAVNVYESTLEAAQRTGTTGAFIAQAQASLERMKAVLLADAAPPSVPAPPAPAPAPVPSAPAPKKPSSARSVAPRGAGAGRG